MRFWRHNRKDQEFDWPVDAVADAFILAMTGRAMRNAGSTFWPEKAEQVLALEPLLRDWLTAEDGFDVVWEMERAEAHTTYCLPGCAMAGRAGRSTHLDGCPARGQSFDDLYEAIRPRWDAVKPRVITAEIDRSDAD